MRRGLLFVVVMLVAGCMPSLGGGDSDVKAAAQELPKVPVVVVLDASGSMKVEDAPGQRFAAAQEAVRSLVSDLSAGHVIGLTVYGTSTGSSEKAKKAGCRDVKRVVPFGKLDKKAFTAAVDGLKPRGYTPIGAAMKDAAGQLPKSGKAAIVLVSDGIDTCAPPDPCEVAKDLRAKNSGLAIHTVAFRVADDPVAREQLSCIADAGGGLDLDASSGTLLRTRLLAAFDPARAASSLQPSGYRGLEPGMSVAAAKKAAPKLASKLDGVKSKGRVEIVYVDCTVVFEDGVVSEIIPKNKKVKTLDGIGLGDDVSSAQSVYASAGTPSTSGAKTVTYVADASLGTGYRMTYKPSKGSTAQRPAGVITRIVVCRCAPSTNSRLAVGLHDSYDGISSAMIWNQGRRIMVKPKPGQDFDVDGIFPVGFIGDRAIFQSVDGAHGHTWKLVSVDALTGEIKATADCEACNSVKVIGDEVVAAEVYNLNILRWDSDLKNKRVVDVSDAGVDEQTAEAGDPMPFISIGAADESAVYLFTRRRGDPVTDDEDYFGQDQTTRVLRVANDGSTRWSTQLRPVAWSHAAALSTDGQPQQLAVTGFGEGLLRLDAKTLKLRDSQPMPTPDTSGQELHFTDDGGFFLSGVSCSACDGGTENWTSSGDDWIAEDPTTKWDYPVCIGWPIMGVRGAMDGAPIESELRIQVRSGHGWKVVDTLDDWYGCAVG